MLLKGKGFDNGYYLCNEYTQYNQGALNKGYLYDY